MDNMFMQPKHILGCSQVAKAPGFDPGIRRFESYRPSHNVRCCCNTPKDRF